MDRFCDHIRILRHGGNVYDPFAERTTPPPYDDPSGIYQIEVYNGWCKAKDTSQNSMMSISEKANFQIYINDTDVDCQRRDTIFIRTNNEGDEIKMTVIEVKPYERNTIIWAMQLKDGENGSE